MTRLLGISLEVLLLTKHVGGLLEGGQPGASLPRPVAPLRKKFLKYRSS